MRTEVDGDTAREVHPWTDFQNPEVRMAQAGVRDFSPKREPVTPMGTHVGKPYGGSGHTVQADAAQVTETPPVEPESAEETDGDEASKEKTQIPPA